MLIHHQQQGLPAANDGQQFRQGAGLQHPNHRLQVRLQRRISRQIATGDRLRHTPQVEHAAYVVQRQADHRKAGVAGVMDRLHQLSEAHIHRQGDHAGARDHHLAHLGVPQGEHSLKNVALVGEEAGDTAGIDQRLQLSSRQGRNQFIPLGPQPHQPQHQTGDSLQQIEQRGQTAHHDLEQGPEPQSRRLRTTQHPGLRQQTCHQAGDDDENQEQAAIQPGSSRCSLRPEAQAEATTGPAQGDQSHAASQLGEGESTPEPPLQTLQGEGAALTLLHQHLNTAGAQAQQRDFRCGAEGRQYQQQRQ